LIFTQGAALGWYVAALSGLRKIKSDFMGSVFYSPAILVTLKSILLKTHPILLSLESTSFLFMRELTLVLHGALLLNVAIIKAFRKCFHTGAWERERCIFIFCVSD